MSKNVTHDQSFRSICNATPEELDYETRGSQIAKKVSEVSSSVIKHLQESNNESDKALVETFISKVSSIGEHFFESGEKELFTTAIVSLNLLVNLRADLSSENQDIIGHPFILELDGLVHLDAIKGKGGVANQLYQFQKDVLNPAIEKAETPKELLALKSLSLQCIELGEKLKSVDKNGVLVELKETTTNLEKMKTAQVDPTYQQLISYSHGSLPKVEQEGTRQRVTKTLTSFSASFNDAVKTSLIPKSDQVAIYNALLTLQEEFEEHGDGAKLEPILTSMGTALNIPTGIKSSFPIELEVFATKKLPGAQLPILQKLITFERDILTPALEQASSRSELLALEPLVDQCIELEAKLNAVSGKSSLAEVHSGLLNQYNAKLHTTGRFYQFLLSYEKGSYNKVNQSEIREKLAHESDSLVTNITDLGDHPTIPKSDKVTLYQALLNLREEFEEHGDGAKLNSTIEKLGASLGLPPQVESAFPFELEGLISSKLKGNTLPILQKLVSFEKTILTPALKQASTTQELDALTPLVDQCITLKQKLESKDQDSLLANAHSELTEHYNLLLITLDPLCSVLTSYKDGDIDRLNEEGRRELVVTKTLTYVKDLAPMIKNPAAASAMKSIYQALLIMQKEFETYDDGAKLTPVLKELRSALKIPKPKPTKVLKKSPEVFEPNPIKGNELFSSVGSVRDMWQKKSEKVSDSPKSASPIASKRKEISPEARIENCTKKI